MKIITAYINTVRVHWLVEELQKAGVCEIVVTEYFLPLSRISRMRLLCEDCAVETVRSIIHRIGTTGTPDDHFFEVSDYDNEAANNLANGKRLSRLESA